MEAPAARAVTPHSPGRAADGGTVVVDWMLRHGIDHFFNVPGESFLPVLDALGGTSAIRLVTNRHESGAAFAAEAYGKLTGKPAVCMATRGPGASNLSIGVQTAHYDGTPMLALVGLSSAELDGGAAFQSFDPQSLFGSIAKNVLIPGDVGTLDHVLEQAYLTAVADRPGPVVVGLRPEVLNGEAGGSPAREQKKLAVAAWDATPVIELLKTAESPILLVATAPVRDSVASRLGVFASAVGIPVAAAWRRYSSFDNEHSNFIGSLGLGSTTQLARAFAESDMVLCVGDAIEDITIHASRMNRPGITVVGLTSAATPEHARLLCDATVITVPVPTEAAAGGLRAWVDQYPDEAQDLHSRHAARTAQLVTEARQHRFPQARSGPLHLDYFMASLDRALPGDAVVTSDAGNFAQWLLRHITFGADRVFLGPVNGAMGYGLPAAIGAALAEPSRTPWCIAGDGGFLMTSPEAETARRLCLDLVAVVVNNSVYGTIQARQEAAYGTPGPGTSLGHVNFAMLAESMGWSSWRVERDEDVIPMLAEVASTKRGAGSSNFARDCGHSLLTYNPRPSEGACLTPRRTTSGETANQLPTRETGPRDDENATVIAVNAIRGMIVQQQLSPGQQVRQEELADAIGLSRSPIREALRALENEGFVRHLPRKGYFVKRFSADELGQIYLMRRVLEYELFTSAAPPTPEEISRLRGYNATIASTSVISDVLSANRSLHFTIFRLSPLSLVFREVERLWNLSESYRAAYLWAPETRSRIVAEHEDMFEALIAGNMKQLAKLADKHRDAARERVIQLFS